MIDGRRPAGNFMAALGDAELAAIRNCGRTRHFSPGDTLMQQGQVGVAVMIVISGRVKIRTIELDGREIILDFRGPGELLGELAVIDGNPRSSSIEAIEAIEVLELPASSFLALVADRREIASALLHDVVGRLRDADRKRIQFGASFALGRVAARLVELDKRFGTLTNQGRVISLPISQEELAGWTGSSREAVAGALRTLRTSGLIATDRRRITVLDLERLAELGC